MNLAPETSRRANERSQGVVLAQLNALFFADRKLSRREVVQFMALHTHLIALREEYNELPPEPDYVFDAILG